VHNNRVYAIAGPEMNFLIPAQVSDFSRQWLNQVQVFNQTFVQVDSFCAPKSPTS
jgi:hypothetical protein